MCFLFVWNRGRSVGGGVLVRLVGCVYLAQAGVWVYRVLLCCVGCMFLATCARLSCAAVL